MARNKKPRRKRNNHYKRFTRNTAPLALWFDWRSAYEENGIADDGSLPLETMCEKAIALDHTIKTPGGGVNPVVKDFLTLSRQWLITLEMDLYDGQDRYKETDYIVTEVCKLDDVADYVKSKKAEMMAAQNPQHVQGISWGIKAYSGRNQRKIEMGG